MKETKVKGFKVIIEKNKIKIFDSYQVTNKDRMIDILNNILNKDDYTVKIDNQILKYYIKKWKIMNILYKLHIFRKYTKNCVLYK